MKKAVLLLLILLNLVVLAGQIWPEGAPPFARVVNVVFLLITMVFFISLLMQKRPKQTRRAIDPSHLI